MKTLCLIAMLLIGTPAWAVPLTFTFDSQFDGGKSIAGAFSYESVQDPLATNVRGLHPNATYALSSYEFLVSPNFPLVGLPETLTFSSDLAGQTVEFCTGICVFSSPNVSNLIFKDGLHTFQLTFAATPDITTWGDFQFGTMRTINPDGSFNSKVGFVNATDPTMHAVIGGDGQRNGQSVPEGPTVLLCFIGLTIAWAMHKWRVL